MFYDCYVMSHVFLFSSLNFSSRGICKFGKNKINPEIKKYARLRKGMQIKQMPSEGSIKKRRRKDSQSLALFILMLK